VHINSLRRLAKQAIANLRTGVPPHPHHPTIVAVTNPGKRKKRKVGSSSTILVMRLNGQVERYRYTGRRVSLNGGSIQRGTLTDRRRLFTRPQLQNIIGPKE
jgi:hypothetical protein